MPIRSREFVLQALADTGRHLEAAGHTTSVAVVLCGAAAGILGGYLPPDRVTLDCDVIVAEPHDRFVPVHQAAQIVAERHGLKPEWLNADSQMFAHLLPVGWRDRRTRVDCFGPLEVFTLHRRDLLALKLAGAAKARPQDLEDLQAMQPTEEDKTFLNAHLDRLRRESLDHDDHEVEQALLNEL